MLQSRRSQVMHSFQLKEARLWSGVDGQAAFKGSSYALFASAGRDPSPPAQLQGIMKTRVTPMSGIRSNPRLLLAHPEEAPNKQPALRTNTAKAAPTKRPPSSFLINYDPALLDRPRTSPSWDLEAFAHHRSERLGDQRVATSPGSMRPPQLVRPLTRGPPPQHHEQGFGSSATRMDLHPELAERSIASSRQGMRPSSLSSRFGAAPAVLSMQQAQRPLLLPLPAGQPQSSHHLPDRHLQHQQDRHLHQPNRLLHQPDRHLQQSTGATNLDSLMDDPHYEEEQLAAVFARPWKLGDGTLYEPTPEALQLQTAVLDRHHLNRHHDRDVRLKLPPQSSEAAAPDSAETGGFGNFYFSSVGDRGLHDETRARGARSDRGTRGAASMERNHSAHHGAHHGAQHGAASTRQNDHTRLARRLGVAQPYASSDYGGGGGSAVVANALIDLSGYRPPAPVVATAAPAEPWGSPPRSPPASHGTASGCGTDGGTGGGGGGGGGGGTPTRWPSSRKKFARMLDAAAPPLPLAAPTAPVSGDALREALYGMLEDGRMETLFRHADVDGSGALEHVRWPRLGRD